MTNAIKIKEPPNALPGLLITHKASPNPTNQVDVQLRFWRYFKMNSK